MNSFLSCPRKRASSNHQTFSYQTPCQPRPFVDTGSSAFAHDDNQWNGLRHSLSATMPVMTRREFIALLGGAVAMPMFRPLAARAQQPAMPVIGYVSSFSPVARYEAAFHQSLKEMGFIA